MNDVDSKQLAWQKMEGLLPAIVQDVETGAILMLGYMNQQALQQTLASRQVTFYSRSKQRLWTKGESSGHYLQLVHITADALLIQATPSGPTCHLGNKTCFAQQQQTDWTFIQDLQTVIATRKQQDPKASYVADLFAKGVTRIAQKVGEEGVEVALAAVTGEETNSASLRSEAADLLFHLLVLLTAKGLTLSDVIAELKRRSEK